MEMGIIYAFPLQLTLLNIMIYNVIYYYKNLNKIYLQLYNKGC